MKIIAALALLIFSCNTNAGYYDGNDLQGLAGFDSPMLSAYIAGVVDADGGKSICLPSGPSVRQLTDIVKIFLTKNPQRRHEQGSILVIESLGAEFPCHGKNSKYIRA